MRALKPVFYFVSIAVFASLVSSGFVYADDKPHDKFKKEKWHDRSEDGKKHDKFKYERSLDRSVGAKMHVRYHGIDKNNDGIITRAEWPSRNDNSFNNHDWNHDGVLSGNEVKPGEHWDKKDRNRHDDDDDDNGDDNDDDDDDGNRWRNRGQNHSGRFQELDNNSDGVISRDEWHRTGRSFDALDRNDNGQIDRDEFFNRSYATEVVFSELDANNNKMISRGEWRGSNENFNRLDINGDNDLSENEFYSREGDSGNIAEQIYQMILGNR